jgi:hypothetical protein
VSGPYGKIDFKSVEIAREDRQLKILEGNFRTKISQF